MHVEVQGAREADFAQRMFVYHYRLYDRYARPVVSLAVLAEPFAGRRGRFGYERWGCRMGLRFPVVSLAGYRDRQAELEASPNPFAVVTQAHLKAQETAHSDEARYQAKRALIRSLYRRGYGALPEWAPERLGQADRAKLESWALRVLSAASLEEVFGPGGGH